MKLKIKPYFLRLLKENTPYLIGLITILVLLLFLIIINLPKITENQNQIEKLSQEVNELKRKLNFINSLTINTKQLEEDIKFINTLIPGEEDYFSIIYALEQLSLKTGFLITSYRVNIKNSGANKLQLEVSGLGDRETFMKFLKEYNFAGGRLITSDKVELAEGISNETKINLTFYNKNVSNEKINLINQNNQFLTEIRELRNKIQFSFTQSSPEADLDYQYPRKTNPF